MAWMQTPIDPTVRYEENLWVKRYTSGRKLFYFYGKEALFNTYSTAYSDSILIGRWASLPSFQEGPNTRRSVLVRPRDAYNRDSYKSKGLTSPEMPRILRIPSSYFLATLSLCNIYICAFVYLAYEICISMWTYQNRKQEI